MKQTNNSEAIVDSSKSKRMKVFETVFLDLTRKASSSNKASIYTAKKFLKLLHMLRRSYHLLKLIF